MKVRIFVASALGIGWVSLALIIAGGTKAEEASQSISSVVSARGVEDCTKNSQDTAVLGSSSEITFTPAFTVCLPTVAKNYPPPFVLPVDLSIAPMYGAYDLNFDSGVIDSNAGPEYSHPIYCDGIWMSPGTNDNHWGYDFGSGNCGADVSGTPVNGMSVGFSGEVIYVPDDGLWVDYGVLKTANGIERRVVIKYGHITPDAFEGQRVDSSTTVGALNGQFQELEIMVLHTDPAETGWMTGPELRGFLVEEFNAGRQYLYVSDPRLMGLYPLLSHGPRG